MSDLQVPTPPPLESAATKSVNAVQAEEYILPKEIEQLPAEMKTMVSVMAGFFRSTSGPDPETSRIVAQSEMHEETCKLEAFKESQKIRDRQNDRDHNYRIKRLNHDTLRSMAIILVCVAGIACGLFLLVVKKDETIGSGLLIACFMALLNGGKSILQKDKD